MLSVLTRGPVDSPGGLREPHSGAVLGRGHVQQVARSRPGLCSRGSHGPGPHGACWPSRGHVARHCRLETPMDPDIIMGSGGRHHGRTRCLDIGVGLVCVCVSVT